MTKILVIAEHQQGKLSASNKNTLAAALKLGSDIDVLVAAPDDSITTDVSSLAGAKEVLLLKHQRFAHVLAEDLTPVIVDMAKSYTHVLASANTFGKNLLPRVAALLNVAQVSDVIAIESPDTFVRPIYAGNALEKVRSKDAIKVLTIRSTAFDPMIATTQPTIKMLDQSITPFPGVEFKNEQTPEFTRPELTAAKIVIAGGRGLKSAENFKLVEALADKLGAAIGASRAAVDAGFVPNDLQVGQTGKVVAPTLYIAIGISGAIQHLAGMKDSKVIVAINKDPDAPIFQVADYGLVGDLFEILPTLQQQL